MPLYRNGLMIEWPEPGIDSRLIGLGIALGLGLLVGLEREWVEDKPIGLRSFGLIGLLGGLAGTFVDQTGPWVIVAGLVALGALLAAASLARRARGITTLVAGLTVYMIGAATVAGYWLHATVIAGAVMLLLHWKEPMHRLVARLGHDDLETVARFILITLVVLPLLPNRAYGPYEVFNPFNTWLLVVLIVAINLAGYVAFRLASSGTGGWIAGVVGGMVSSTATTIGYASLSREAKKAGPVATLVILVASTVVYARIALEVSVVAPGLLRAIAWPSIAFAIVLAVCCLVVFTAVNRQSSATMPKPSNPARIGAALAFGAVYLVVLFAVAAARDLVGNNAVYAVALISGLTDVDALTLSMSRLFDNGQLDTDIAWRAIFLGSLSNLLFKIGAAAVIGSRSLRLWILAAGMPALLAGIAIFALWPSA